MGPDIADKSNMFLNTISTTKILLTINLIDTTSGNDSTTIRTYCKSMNFTSDYFRFQRV